MTRIKRLVASIIQRLGRSKPDSTFTHGVEQPPPDDK